MRSILPLIACLLAACNADQPQDEAEAPADAASSQITAVQNKASADVEAALAEAR